MTMGKAPPRRTLFPAIPDLRKSPKIVAAHFSHLGATLNGGNVSAMADQTGNGWHLIQATNANQPAYTASGGQNGKPFITATGSSVGTFLASIADFSPVMGASGMTVVAVGSVAADHFGGILIGANGGGPNGIFSLGQVGGSTGNFNFGITTPGPTSYNNFGNPGKMTQVHIWRGIYDGQHNTSYIDGVQYLRDAQGVPSGVFNTVAGAKLAMPVNFGGAVSGTVTYYCSLVWARALPLSEIAYWENNLLNQLYKVY